MKSWTPYYREPAHLRLQRERNIRSIMRWIIAGLLAFLTGGAVALIVG
jgi:hypothetical protein